MTNTQDSTVTPAAETELARLRKAIDRLDDAVAELMIERMAHVREVAALKAEHWPANCHIRPGREGAMHRRVVERFKGSGFSPLAGLAIWRQIIGASTQLESPLTAAHLASAPEHGWMAMAYFGVETALVPVASLEKAGEALRHADANLLLLSMPEYSDWWKDWQGGARIFARIPAGEFALPGGTKPAVALADIAPEPSGDDISYFVVRGAAPTAKDAAIVSANDAHLLVYEGFVTPEDERLRGLAAQWLGAHPRPITLKRD